MNFEQAKQIMWKKLGENKVMTLATTVNDYPMVRSVSCAFYNDKIYFKTDKNFKKTEQLLKNSQVALCFWGVQVEGKALNKGLVIDEPGHVFEKKFTQYYDKTYIAYAHTESEILIEVTPNFVEIWDQDENHKAFQLLIDFDKQTAEYVPYD